MIRTTNNQSAVHVLDDLQRVSANLQHTQRKLSTGKEINQVEDDPVGAGRAMHLRSEVSDVQQYQKNINEALGFQDASESAMSSVQDSKATGSTTRSPCATAWSTPTAITPRRTCRPGTTWVVPI